MHWYINPYLPTRCHSQKLTIFFKWYFFMKVGEFLEKTFDLELFSKVLLMINKYWHSWCPGTGTAPRNQLWQWWLYPWTHLCLAGTDVKPLNPLRNIWLISKLKCNWSFYCIDILILTWPPDVIHKSWRYFQIIFFLWK